jgi:(E)-4-hydroxy-3-methylbut-2-enyl-diphosphate synthase
VEAALEALARNSPGPLPKVAVMGCAVNGPGEARDADVALCGGDGFFMLFEKGRMVRRVEEGEAVRVVLESVAAMCENLPRIQNFRD